MAKYLNLAGLQTLWEKIKSFFALKENGVYYVPGTSGYANWSANTAYAVGANVVNPSGECWTCKTAHTSGSSWSSTNWNRISAVALTGTIDGVTALYAGLKIAYRFQVLGGEGSTTLNVNNLGAKTITRGTGAFYRWTIGRNGVAILVYDGSAWRFGDYDSNDQYFLPDAYCSTAAGTQAKAATSIGFSYSRHNNIPFRIYFTAANTYNGNLTMNVNSQGAKPLWINGSASSSSNKTIAVGVYWCYYDGTQFQLWTDKSIWGLKVRGDGSNLTEAFTAASSRANIASGESNATIFGKIAKWLGDLKALAFKDAVSDSDISGTISDNHIASASTWNGKYTKPSGGIPKTDLASAVQTSLGKADGALQSESDPVFSASPAAGITSNDISNWNGKSPNSHTHKVKINGNEKTIAATGGTAVDLGTYLTAHQDISGKVDKTTVTLLADWNTLNTTGIYEVESQTKTVAHSPEPGKVACYVTVVDGYITQLAVGDRVRKRCMPAGTQVWEDWVVLQDSSGLTVNELYTTSAGGYIDIHGASIEAGGPDGTTKISGGGISTPSLLVNGKSITQKFYTSYTGQTTSMSSAQNNSVRVLSKSSGIQLGKKMMFCMSFRMLNMNIPGGSYKLFEFRLYNKEQTAQDSRGRLLGGQTVIVRAGDNNVVIEIPFTWTSGSFGIGVNMFWDSSYTVSSNESVVIENGDAFLYQIEN